MSTVAAIKARIEQSLAIGRVEQARREIDALGRIIDTRHAGQHHLVAQYFMHARAPARALEYYDRAAALAPDSAECLYNRSTALISLGRLEKAEADLARVIALNPDDWDAWYNRSTLRRQTPENNHVEDIREAIDRLDPEHAGQIPLNHALARELEDLGRHEESFAALKRGADRRRSQLAYRVEDDVDMMDAIIDAFPDPLLPSPQGTDGRHDGDRQDSRPVFVIGLPRSGTTLVDRILSSHSRIGSHGEGPDLALALMDTAGPCSSKQALLERSVRMDHAAMGKKYMARIEAVSGQRVVDKTPANFLYLGLVSKALPNARIIYVRRNRMDVCYAMYKTLFRTAYPFSYDLSDLADYWTAFDSLMRHWQATLPDRQLLTIDYEDLVQQPETVSRRLLSHVDMPWEPACLDFSSNTSPTLTASAAQVRRPIYTSSVGLWKKYRQQLQPLAGRILPVNAHHSDGAFNP